MDHTERFVSDANIARFVEQLRGATDPRRQETLKILLIEEEYRFGAREERLAMVEQHLTDGAAHIVRLTGVVAQSDGDDRTRTESSLRLCEALQALFEDFRSAIYEKRERGDGSL